MASTQAQSEFRGYVGNGTAEGVSIAVEPKPNAKDITEQLAGGIRSGLSYSGCRTIKELQQDAIFVKVTANTVRENEAKTEK